MKQKEKNALSRQRILGAALEEFGSKSYESASLNTMCQHGGISKGRLYHYFSGKDELYLQCVSETYSAFIQYLSRGMDTSREKQEGDFDALMNLRFQFFRENPAYATIFFETTLCPPEGLAQQIREIRKELAAFHLGQYEKLLDTIRLREDISRQEALSCFEAFQEMMDGYFQSRAKTADDFRLLMADHEALLSKLLRIFLYGIAVERSGM